jgi:hypothetical protein
MAQKWEIIEGPELWQLILALTEGKKVQFTLKPPDQRGSWVCEAQIFSWGVIGAHREHEMTLFGRVTAIKEPKHVGLRSKYLNFRGSYKAFPRKGEATTSAPDEG